ncbi:thermonuclease family protein [Micromonosporaceae bacterium Da 78-11]
MPLWTYPAITTGPVTGPHVPVTLDLGCRLTHPATVRIAGVNPRLGGSTEAKLQNLLPEGARILVLAERITGAAIRAHILLDDGSDTVALLRHRTGQLPPAEYGGTLGKRWRYPAIVDRVCDGDSFVVSVDVGIESRLKATVRVAHVDAPEHGTAQGQAATVWAEQQLTPGAEVVLDVHRLDKYGRLLAEVTTFAGDYSTAILAAGHAIRYEGGPR